MFYALVLIAIILGVLYEKSRPVRIFQLALIWILLGWSYGNADYQNYLTRYIFYNSHSLMERTERLFFQLFKVGNAFHLTYAEFLPILAFLYVMFIGCIIRKLSSNPNLVLSLYLIFPACVEATQIRFALAGAVILVGFILLFNENLKLGELYFGVCVILAALLHIGTIIFLAMIPIRRLNRRKTYIYTFTVCIIVSVMGLGGVNAILSLFPGMLTKLSLVTSYSMKTIRYWILVEILIWLFFMGMVKVFEKFCDPANLENRKKFDYIVKAGIISAVTIPVTLLFQDAYRVQQCLCILYFCALSNVFPNGVLVNFGAGRIGYSKTRIALIAGSVVLAAFALYAIILSSSNYNTVFVPYFEKNTFFDLIF